MARVLTRRKQAWIPRKNTAVVIGQPLNNPTILEVRYAKRLEALVAEMADSVQRELERFFKEPHAEEYFEEAMDASVSSQARILTNALMKKFNGLFSLAAPPIAEQHTKAVKKASTLSVKTSLKDIAKGLSFGANLSEETKQVLNASIVEQVSLIKSISMEYLSGVQGAVMRSISSGRGLADLAPFMEKHKEITQRRARMIAYDQTRKAYNNLNRASLQQLGLTKFRWLHTGGSKHPRKLHIQYNGEVFSFDNPPIIVEETGERGIPGQAINCRCRMQAVISFEDD